MLNPFDTKLSRDVSAKVTVGVVLGLWLPALRCLYRTLIVHFRTNAKTVHLPYGGKAKCVVFWGVRD